MHNNFRIKNQEEYFYLCTGMMTAVLFSPNIHQIQQSVRLANLSMLPNGQKKNKIPTKTTKQKNKKMLYIYNIYFLNNSQNIMYNIYRNIISFDKRVRII